MAAARAERTRWAALPGLLVLALGWSAGGCGGESLRRVDEGSGGSGTTGGAGSGATGGGATGGTGGAGSGGTSVMGGGGGGCSIVCGPVDCPDGDVVYPPGCGCPACSCGSVACFDSECAPGSTARRQPNYCCTTCVPDQPAGCDGVACQPVPSPCPSGSTLERPLGACCTACVPDEPPGCLEVACPHGNCPPGYMNGNGVNGCCYDCVPDPYYCESDADCLVATNTASCCPCQLAISERLFVDEPCFSSPDVPRSPPATCAPSACTVDCTACFPAAEASCVANHCLSFALR